MKICPNCGNPLSNSAPICPHCGSINASYNVNPPLPQDSAPNKISIPTPKAEQPMPPQNVIAPKPKSNNRMSIIIVIMAFLLIAAGVAIFALITTDDQDRKSYTEEYTEQTDEPETHDYTDEAVAETSVPEVMKSHPLSVTYLSGGEHTTVAPIGNLTYDPANAFDGKLETCWAIDHETLYDEYSERGRVIHVNVHGNYLTGMTIYNGYQKSQDRFINNMSPKEILIGITDPDNSELLKKTIYQGTLQNVLGPQHFEFPQPIKIQGEEISICILTWYDCPSPKGDVSLSELEFIGY